MAIMSRRKRAVAQGWEATNKQREEQNKVNSKEEKKEITEEEHQKRVKLLKEMGLLK